MDNFGWSPNRLEEQDGATYLPDSRETKALNALAFFRRSQFVFIPGEIIHSPVKKGGRGIGSLPPKSTEAHDTPVV